MMPFIPLILLKQLRFLLLSIALTAVSMVGSSRAETSSPSVAFTPVAPTPVTPTPVVRIGVLAYQGSERASLDWESTIRHLNAALPGQTFVMVPFDLMSLTDAVAHRRVDFIITNPGHYVTLEARFAVTRIATVESRSLGSPMAAVGSTVIRRHDRHDINSFTDLRGKVLAVVAVDAFGGFQIAWREFKKAGLQPFSDLQQLITLGYPMERVVDAVRDGRADAGVLRACLLEELIRVGRVRRDEFTVIGRRETADMACQVSSRLYPDWPFAQLAHTPRDLARRVTAALLTMPEGDSKAWTASLDYTSVHELFRVLRIRPYDQPLATLGQMAATLARDYLTWLVAGGVGIVWWIVHVARVEELVRRRTAELEREIAERSRAEAAAQRLREERDQLSRLGIVGEIAGNIAHELNQPLAAIANYAHGMSRLLASPVPDVERLRIGAQLTAEQAERAAAIIQRTRNFVRRRSTQYQELEINRVVNETLTLLCDGAERHRVRIVTRLDDALPYVFADKVELQQVLLNLLQNAVEAMAECGAVTGEATVTISTRLVEDRVEVRVCDQGKKADVETLAKMFDPFFTTKPDGLGLGLSICATIMERHGGRIWAEANPDQGVTVAIALPVLEKGAGTDRSSFEGTAS